jgi:hypothetical protein
MSAGASPSVSCQLSDARGEDCLNQAPSGRGQGPLRTGRALRVPRARARQRAWAHVTPEVLISERPAEVEDRAVPGHWEGDLRIGLQRSATGTWWSARPGSPCWCTCPAKRTPGPSHGRRTVPHWLATERSR